MAVAKQLLAKKQKPRRNDEIFVLRNLPWGG